MYQNVFNKQLAKYGHSVLLNDGILKDTIMEILTSNIKSVRSTITKSLTKEEKSTYASVLGDPVAVAEYVYSEYADNLTIELPAVEMSREEGTLDGLDAFSNMLDNYLPMIISSDTLPQDLMGDLSDKMDNIMTAIKTVMIKNWVDDHAFLPELTKFTTLDDEGNPRYDILAEYTNFTDALTKAVMPHLKEMAKTSDKTNDKISKIDQEEEPAPDDTGDTGGEDVTPEDGGDGGDALPDDGAEDTPAEGDTGGEDLGAEDPGDAGGNDAIDA